MAARERAKFRATTGDLQAFGETPQDALAELMGHVSRDADGPIVIWPYNRGDTFFSQAQQARLIELKSRQQTLRADERAELEELVAAAFDATIARTRSLPLVKS
jgi:hypothetical protein